MMTHDAKEFLKSALGLGCEDSPFPWQEDLLARMLEGELPEGLDIPTGLGKTSVMAIWLVARACGARLPRRLVYVVDRRAVVDQATEDAIGLRDWAEKNPPVAAALGIGDRALPISTLRGQFVDNREWLEDPSAPAIIVGTVDMIGSRLLFEGYGVSRKMRPYHAGLLGADTLAVLDEAHLVPPFEHLLRAIATEPAFRPRDKRCDEWIPRFRLLALSATGRTHSGKMMGLTKKDLEHPVVRKRVNARKALQLVPLGAKTKPEEALANHAWRVTENGRKATRVIIYSDSRAVAQKAKEALEKLARGDKKSGAPRLEVDTELLVGGRRVFEREAAKKRLDVLGFIAGSNRERERPAFLFATSAGEVGIDLDADHMVCDLVEWERMVQRLGRVNRRGEPDEHTATVVVLIGSKPEADKKVQQTLAKKEQGGDLDEKELKRVEKYEEQIREWNSRQRPLHHLRKLESGLLDAGIAALMEVKKRAETDEEMKQIIAKASSPEPLRPSLTLPSVEAWSLTSLKKHPGRPEVQPWLRGWIKDKPPTTVIWRTHLPVRRGGREARKAEIEAFFEAAPPHTSELLEAETYRVADWLLTRAKRIRDGLRHRGASHGTASLDGEGLAVFVLDSDGSLKKWFFVGGVETDLDKDELRGILTGSTLIVDARLAGLSAGLLDEKASELPMTADGGDWLEEGIVGFRIRCTDSSSTPARARNWRERFRFACEVSEDGDPSRWLVVDKWRSDAAMEEDRAEGPPQLLEEHQKRAEQRARNIAKRLGLNSEFEEVLALAALLHDEGKSAARWQAAFNAPDDRIYAKTEGPINHGILDGYRHELGSLLQIENDARVRCLSPEQRDLMLHLVAAHHGFARPVIGTNGCEDAPPSVLEDKAAEIALRFARLQADWGPWGLAWCESLLRAADQLASRDNAEGRSDERDV
jgi:CRISPR-associated endonuclease/helicase Cas3